MYTYTSGCVLPTLTLQDVYCLGVHLHFRVCTAYTYTTGCVLPALTLTLQDAFVTCDLELQRSVILAVISIENVYEQLNDINIDTVQY